MAEGRTYVRWWTKYYILNARYFAMRLRLLDRKGGHTKGPDKKYRAERYKAQAVKFNRAVQTANYKDWDLIFEARSIKEYGDPID